MIYGPEGKGSFLMLYRLLATGFPLPLGLARSSRSFCSVRNVVSATMMAVDAPTSGVFLPADPEDASTRDLIEAICAASGRAPPFLAPIPPAIMKAALSLLGQADAAASLFEPLAIDRNHWSEWGWRPVQSGDEAIVETVRSLQAGSRTG